MITTLKTCFKCGEEKPYSEFYKHSKMADGHLGKCKTCTKQDVAEHRAAHIEKVKEYDRNRPNSVERTLKACIKTKCRRQIDPLFKERINEQKRKSREASPLKTKARHTLSNAIRDGKVLRPSSCSSCNKSCTPHGHHWSYEEPYWLDVVWLCTKCHGEEHKRLNREMQTTLEEN